MAKHFVVAVEADTSRILTRAAPEPTPLDPKGWTLTASEASGVSMVVLTAEPGAAEFEMHASPDAWLATVLEGRGTMLHGAADGSTVGEIEVAAGDFLTFEPNAQHAWKASGDGLKMLFVKQA